MGDLTNAIQCIAIGETDEREEGLWRVRDVRDQLYKLALELDAQAEYENSERVAGMLSEYATRIRKLCGPTRYSRR